MPSRALRYGPHRRSGQVHQLQRSASCQNMYLDYRKPDVQDMDGSADQIGTHMDYWRSRDGQDHALDFPNGGARENEINGSYFTLLFL